MRTINSNQCVKIPKDIKATVKSRIVTITGPRGSLKRNFKHLALDIYMVNPRLLKVEKWFGAKKELAAVRTVCSHIENMIKGMYNLEILFDVHYSQLYLIFIVLKNFSCNVSLFSNCLFF